MNEQKLNGIYDNIYEIEARLTTLEQNGIPGVVDFFATSALSCLANPAVAAGWNTTQISEFAYDLAEKMMAERAKRNVK